MGRVLNEDGGRGVGTRVQVGSVLGPHDQVKRPCRLLAGQVQGRLGVVACDLQRPGEGVVSGAGAVSYVPLDRAHADGPVLGYQSTGSATGARMSAPASVAAVMVCSRRRRRAAPTASATHAPVKATRMLSPKEPP